MLDLAARMGRECLHGGRELQNLDGDPGARELVEEIEELVQWISDSELMEPGPDGTFGHLLDEGGLGATLTVADTYSPMGHYAVLRGMLNLLRRFFDSTTGTVELRNGLPVPIPSRGVNTLFRTTPKPEAAHTRDPLQGSSFYLFNSFGGPHLPVTLDYRARKSLPKVTWPRSKAGKARLPRIATIHPHLGKDGIEVDKEDRTAGSFFGVHPRRWNPDEVLDALRKVHGKAEIAVLPELSLPSPDALGTALAAAPDDFPPLIIAGSAHVEETRGGEQVRANEARIYLDGQIVGSHRKIRAFEMGRGLDGKKLPATAREGLTDEPKQITVLASDDTRLAVLICSDLLDPKIGQRLEDASVNLLLVPALTPEPGSFNGDICVLAGHFQAVSVVVNVDSSAFEGVNPFEVLAAVPRPRAPDQSREYRRRWPWQRRAIGLFDPNRRLPEALRWMR